MKTRLITLSFASLLALVAVTIHAQEKPAPEGTTPVVANELKVTSDVDGNHLTWTIASPERYKYIEIIRNSVRSNEGRSRIASIRMDQTGYVDNIADLTVTYWYWLKLARIEGGHSNIGPVAPSPSTE